jgi:hypothetical protein
MKTIKDIKTIRQHNFPKRERYLVDLEEVRAEAVKRIIGCNCSFGTNPLLMCGGCQRDYWFNNLTEEDLK